jgi:hypothetical protein
MLQKLKVESRHLELLICDLPVDGVSAGVGGVARVAGRVYRVQKQVVGDAGQMLLRVQPGSCRWHVKGKYVMVVWCGVVWQGRVSAGVHIGLLGGFPVQHEVVGINIL